MSRIYKEDYEYPDGSKAEDTLELIIDSQKDDYLRFGLSRYVDTWYAKPLCAVIGPHWTEIDIWERGCPDETLDEVKQWVADYYDEALLPFGVPEWYGIESKIPDETIQQLYDQLTTEWFAETYGVAWPPPFPVGNPQVEASFEPDWSRKESTDEPPPQLKPKRPKLGSKRQKPHGKRHERQNPGV